MENTVETIKKATVYFIYSFMPTLNEFSLKDKDIILLYESLKSEQTLNGKITFDEGKPKSRIGISTFNSLEHKNIGFLQLPFMDVEAESLTLKITPLFRFFPNGSTLTFQVETQTEDIQPNEIHEILHLVSQEKNEKAKVPIILQHIETNDNAFMFYEQFFVNDNGKYKTTIFELFKGIVKKTLSLDEDKNEENKDKIKFNLKCEQYLNKNQQEPRTPWVITVLDVDDELHNVFCSGQLDESLSSDVKSDAILEHSKIIAPILYRSVTGEDFKLEPSYPFLPKRLNFFNLNLDSRLYVDISRRSILCITNDQLQKPASYFIPVLLDISEMTFTRWQSLLIINKIIDDALKNFTDETLNARERVEKIMKLIIKFSSCLEDTSNYFIGGDALREIHDKLIDNFKINDLLNITLKKIDMLEKYSKYSLEISWSKID